MEPDLNNSLRMSDDEEEESKNNETSRGGSGKRRTTRNESEKRRRDKLNIYINELASMVPTCAASQKKLDKTTILKMTVNYMRIHNDLTGSVLGKEYGLHMSFLSSGEVASLLDESLNGFMFVLSITGEIINISQSITPLLGYEVDQIMGRNLLDFIHPEDKSIVLYELREDSKDFIMESDFNGLHKINSKPVRHSFDVRIGCAPDKHFTDNQDSYEKVHVIGYTDIWESKKPSQDAIVSGCTVARREEQGEIFTEKPRCLVAVGLLTRPGLKRFASINESTPVEFESRHTMDGKFLFVDPRSITLTGFWPYELLGTSLYSYVHHDDMQMLASVHQLLLEYGECKTEPYRMRSKGDQWLWMKSRSFISYNHWNSKPEFFCSTNVAVCNKDGMESLRERQKASLCSAQQMQTSIVPVGNNSCLYPAYKNQQEAGLTTPGFAVQQENVGERNAACKELIPSMNDLSSTTVPPVNSDYASNGKNMSTEGSESHQLGDDEADSDSNDSMDLTMSYEELENFIEAQGQLHDQLMMKHAVLEETITKQKQQLQAVQQQMLLNLQAQLTINPGESQELFEEQFKRTKRVSEMHDKQEATHKELVETLKERRRQTEKRNQRQLKYYLEKRMKVATDASSLPQATQSTSLDMRTTIQPVNLNNVANVTVLEEKRTTTSMASMREQFTPTEVHHQIEQIREGVQKKAPVSPMVLPRRTVQYPASQQCAKQSNISYAPDGRQPIADGQFLSTAPGMAPSFISQQNAACRDFQTSQQTAPVYPRVQELVSRRKPQSFASRAEKTNLPVLFPAGGFATGAGEPPSTLSNIQSLLTASSQNPESMQKLLSGLSSQPDVAQTLLGLLKQAQDSGANEQDSLFDQNLQKTTNHFSSALGTDGNRNNTRNLYQFENLQGLQKQQQSSLRATSTASARHNIEQQMHARSRTLTSLSSSTSTWSGSSTGDPSAVGSPFLQHASHAPRKQAADRRMNDKQKDNKKDYFSNFSSQELEAMFLTTAPKPPPRTTASSSNSVEETKLQEEQLLHSPLLIQQQQLLQMHQDQRKQLLVRQQEQLLMANQKHNQTQPLNISFTDDSQQGSLRSLLSDTNHPGTSTSTRDQEQQASTSNSAVGQSSASWDSLTSNNFELNEADEQVLNMLLAESSMDTLLDPSPWPDTDNLLEYLNMNPDLTSD